jgi:hypothetical protein
MFSLLFTAASAVCVQGFPLLSLWLCWKFTGLNAAIREKQSYTAAICRRKRTRYNIHVKLDVMCCKKRDEHVIGIARATQIPGMMIHTTLKSAQWVETKAVKALEGEN